MITNETKVPRLSRGERNRLALSTDHLQNSLGARAAQGGSIAICGQGLRLVAQLISSAILARLLAPSDFGLVAMATTIMALVNMFTDLGLSAAAVQRKVLEQDTASGLLVVNVLMGLAVMAAAVAIAPFAAILFDDKRVFWLVAVMSATIPIGAATAVQQAILQRRMEWGALQLIAISSQVLGIAGGVLLAWKTDLGYWALVANPWISAVIYCSATWAVSPWRPSRVSDWTGVRESLNFGMYLTGFGLVNYFHRQADNVLVGWRFGVADLGYYGRAYALFFLPTTSLMWPIASTAKSILARTADEPERYCAAFHRLLLPLTITIACAGGVAHLGAYWIITLFYGNQWQPSVTMFSVLALALPVQSLIVSQGWLYISSGRTKSMFYASILTSTCFLAAFAVAINFSLLSVAIAYSTTSLVLSGPLVWLATRQSHMTFGAYAKVQFIPPVVAFAAIGLIYIVLPPSSGDGDYITALVRVSAYLTMYGTGLAVAAFFTNSFGEVVRDLLRRMGQSLNTFSSRLGLRMRRQKNKS